MIRRLEIFITTSLFLFCFFTFSPSHLKAKRKAAPLYFEQLKTMGYEEIKPHLDQRIPSKPIARHAHHFFKRHSPHFLNLKLSRQTPQFHQQLKKQFSKKASPYRFQDFLSLPEKEHRYLVSFLGPEIHTLLKDPEAVGEIHTLLDRGKEGKTISFLISKATKYAAKKDKEQFNKELLQLILLLKT